MGKCKPKFKMPIAERAKQFAPFSPLNGLHAALVECERLREERRYPDSDAVAVINEVLNKLRKGDTVAVFFYNSAEMRYEQTEGEIGIIDELHQRIFVCGAEIHFDDILEISMRERGDKN